VNVWREGWRCCDDRRNHAVLLQTIVTNFAVSTELLVSGPIASKACSACRMGVSTNTLPETCCQRESGLLQQRNEDLWLSMAISRVGITQMIVSIYGNERELLRSGT